MVKQVTNRGKVKYFKLFQIATDCNKVLFFIATMAAIIGFTFLLTFSSLSETIIKTKQNHVTSTYGKFLIVASDITKNQAEKIKKNHAEYEYTDYEIIGNIKFGEKTYTMGAMQESMGKDLGFHLTDGKWPESEKDIVIEEYLKPIFHIEDKTLPYTVSMQINGQTKEYKITGIISNYSSMLSVGEQLTIDTNVYPSIILGKKKNDAEKCSLVIKQKKLNYRTANEESIALANELANMEPAVDNISINEKLYGKGWMDNADMIYLKIAYQIILNVLLLFAQIMVLRYFILKNKKLFSLFQALGLSKIQKKYYIAGLIGINLVSSFLISSIFTLLIGNIFFNQMFAGYNGYFVHAFQKCAIVEIVIIVLIILGITFFEPGELKEASIMENRNHSMIQKRKYTFKKIDWLIVFMNIVSMFFIMASIDFAIMFKVEQKDARYDMYSKVSESFQMIEGYHLSSDKESNFSFDSIEPLMKYKNYIYISTEGASRHSSLILNKPCKDQYFNQSYFTDQEEIENQKLKKQMPKETKKYKAISDMYLNLEILPQKEYEEFLKKNKINNKNLENQKEDSCILVLPDYNVSDKNSCVQEKGSIQLARMEQQEDGFTLLKHSFTVEKLITDKINDSDNIALIMSEQVAQKSNFINGYDEIHVTVKKDCPKEIQKKIETEIQAITASIQGGRLDSSVQENENDILLGKYTTLISKTVFAFSIFMICIYIILNNFIDMEKNRHEYGVLQSFGMSYAKLQHKLFVKYSNSMVIAAIVAIFIGNMAFPDGELKLWQILAAILAVIMITYICRIWIYLTNKNKSIAALLKDSDE